jgi:hypothetical protein
MLLHGFAEAGLKVFFHLLSDTKRWSQKITAAKNRLKMFGSG